MTTIDTPRIYVILGMHRSGTSVAARCLTPFGVSLGPHASATGPDNPRGFWEDSDVVEINNSLLDIQRQRWSSIQPVDSFQLLRSDRARELRDEAVRLLQSRLEEFGTWAFKDPRACLTLPFWKEAFAELGLKGRYLFPFRHPTDVADSLQERNHFSSIKSCLLWTKYVCSALPSLVGETWVAVKFDDIIDSPVDTLDTIQRVLEIPASSRSEHEVQVFSQAYLGSELRHHKGPGDGIPRSTGIPGIAEAIYSSLSTGASDASMLPVEDWQRAYLDLAPLAAYAQEAEDACESARERSRSAEVQRDTIQTLYRDSQELLRSEQGKLAEARFEADALREQNRQFSSRLEEVLDQLCRADKRIRAHTTSNQRLAMQRARLEERCTDLNERLTEQGSLLQTEARELQTENRRLLTDNARLTEAQSSLDPRGATAAALTLSIERERAAAWDLLQTSRRFHTSLLMDLQQVASHVAQVELEERNLSDRVRLQLETLAQRLDESRAALTTARALNDRLSRDLHSIEASELETDAARQLAEQRAVSLERQVGRISRRARGGRPERQAPRKLARLLVRAYGWLPGSVQRVLRGIAERLTPNLRERILALAGQHGHPGSGTMPPASPRQARLLRAAREAAGPRPDIFVFPVIDWDFRIQRPQHIARELALRGHRVFYLTTTFLPDTAPPFQITASPKDGTFLVSLRCVHQIGTIYETLPTDEVVSELSEGLYEFRRQVASGPCISVVHLPFWRRIAERVAGSLIVYDCMDYHAGFETNRDEMLDEEHALIADADLVVVTSDLLEQRLSQIRPVEVIPNACDFPRFSSAPPDERFVSEEPTIGYVGAISSWFDIELVLECARRRPGYRFVLAGSLAGCDDLPSQLPSNVELLGEIPYDDVPSLVSAFDVGLIPFKVCELTLATNPVKLYEYFSTGLPVVSIRLPEVEKYENLAYLADDVDSFVERLDAAVAEPRGSALRPQRIAFAQRNTWSERAERLDLVIDTFWPKVSIIVLTCNNLEFTKACLHSLDRFTWYPHREVLVVDNASTDGTRDYLETWGTSDSTHRVVLNGDNLGFAGGNNVGLSAATGDIRILLNNDTFVTPGWLVDLTRHFRKDPSLGLLGPVTNNIGNEARIDINYANMEEMAIAARRFTLAHKGERLYVDTLGFFCVAIPKQTYDVVGALDERFVHGFFEDDDYCRRVAQAGFRIAIAEDVFVHHHLSATFEQIDQERRKEIFERNRRVYEEKWGTWTPHSYRPSGKDAR